MNKFIVSLVAVFSTIDGDQNVLVDMLVRHGEGNITIKAAKEEGLVSKGWPWTKEESDPMHVIKYGYVHTGHKWPNGQISPITGVCLLAADGKVLVVWENGDTERFSSVEEAGEFYGTAHTECLEQAVKDALEWADVGFPPAPTEECFVL